MSCQGYQGRSNPLPILDQRASLAMCHTCRHRRGCGVYTRATRGRVTSGKTAHPRAASCQAPLGQPPAGRTSPSQTAANQGLPGPRFHTAADEICPRGRWPKADGTVRWLGLTWIGVPYPIRLRIALEGAWKAWRVRTGCGYLPGCGCLSRLDITGNSSQAKRRIPR